MGSLHSTDSDLERFGVWTSKTAINFKFEPNYCTPPVRKDKGASSHLRKLEEFLGTGDSHLGSAQARIPTGTPRRCLSISCVIVPPATWVAGYPGYCSNTGYPSTRVPGHPGMPRAAMHSCQCVFLGKFLASREFRASESQTSANFCFQYPGNSGWLETPSYDGTPSGSITSKLRPPFLLWERAGRFLCMGIRIPHPGTQTRRVTLWQTVGLPPGTPGGTRRDDS
eukprot:122163-Rhodomonas_salina.1